MRLLSCLLLGVMLVGCSPGDRELDRLLEHTEAIVSLLEQHKDTPAQAIEAVERYQQEHADELARLRDMSREFRSEVGTKGKREMLERWRERSAELKRRVEALQAEVGHEL